MDKIWFILRGGKTASIFDIWTIEHFLSGISAGALVNKFNTFLLKKYLGEENYKKVNITYFDLAGVLFLAYAWETIEHYLETGLAGKGVEYWFQGTEFWANRIISDPLMLVLGYFVYRKFPKLAWPARIFSIIWLFVHVFIFPESMYLQHVLLGI